MAAKLCSLCKTRPVGTGTGHDAKHARTMGYCNPCLTEAEMENEHSDYGHDEGKDADGNPTNGCWICHPELNAASADYQPRKGTSRAGMQLTVPLRATGKEKAARVSDQLPPSFALSVRTAKGVTTLKASSAGETLVLNWDLRGRFLQGLFTTEGKTRKVRNAAEAIRLTG